MIAEMAPAKINLYLHILGRRADGYHEIDSLVVFAGAGDRLEIEAGGELSLEIVGPFAGDLGTGGDNLVLRAADMLRQWGGIATGAKLRLTKNLPIASGIGGGSSDAAAALRLLMALWDLHPSGEDLDRLALRLGADLPVCLRRRPCRVGGIGERIEILEAPLPAAHLLLVNPREKTPTPAVYRAFRGPFSPPAPRPETWETLDGLLAFLEGTRNDLAEPAAGIAPAIPPMLAAITATPGCRLARLSGSGATGFGLYAKASEAEEARLALLDQHPDWWAIATPITDGDRSPAI